MLSPRFNIGNSNRYAEDDRIPLLDTSQSIDDGEDVDSLCTLPIINVAQESDEIEEKNPLLSNSWDEKSDRVLPESLVFKLAKAKDLSIHPNLRSYIPLNQNSEIDTSTDFKHADRDINIEIHESLKIDSTEDIMNHSRIIFASEESTMTDTISIANIGGPIETEQFVIETSITIATDDVSLNNIASSTKAELDVESHIVLTNSTDTRHSSIPNNITTNPFDEEPSQEGAVPPIGRNDSSPHSVSFSTNPFASDVGGEMGGGSNPFALDADDNALPHLQVWLVR